MATTKTDKNPVIETFGIQSGTDRTLYATWRWNGGVVKGSDRTDHYRVLWEYTTGDGVWFEGSDSTSTKAQSTYNAPSNAKKVRVRVKAIAKKHKVNKKEVAWFATTDWSTVNGKVKAVIKFTEPIVIGQPPVPTVTIENYILTVSVTNLATDINADEIMFEIVQDDVTVITGAYPVDINLSTASMALPIEAGHVYKARCVAYNSKEEEQSEWTDYSANVGTIPVGPSGFNTVEAASESSVKLTWTASLNVTGYDIEYTSDRNYFDTSNQTQTLSIEGGGSTVGIVTGLETGKEWFFRIKAKNANGESGWSGIASVVLGKDPAAPTTWSSSTTCKAGEVITLYWIHNSEDNSPQTSAEIKVSLIVGGSVTSETTIPITTTDTDATKTYSYAYETNGLTENTRILWSVRTAGITGNYSEWSTVREINVYAPPTLVLEVTDQNGTAIDTVTEYPIKVKATPGPVSQNAVSMYLEVVANESYTTVDNIGNEKMVKKGEKIYSTVVDRPSTEYGCIFWLYPSSVNLDNNISYTVNCLVSMDTGLTAESSKEFTVSWTETQYVPNAEIGINKDDISAYIKPYAEGEETGLEGEIVVTSEGLMINRRTSMPYPFGYGCAVVYNDQIIILGGDRKDRDSFDFYSWNGDKWDSTIPSLPYTLNKGCAVVYNNEIHILGGYQGSSYDYRYRKAHYKCIPYDRNWESVSTLPYDFVGGSAVVYDGCIHILGGYVYSLGTETKHYKWDGTEWSEVSTLPYEFYYGSAVVYNNEIHILGGAKNNTAHYKWDGTEWSEVSMLPYEFYYGSAVVYDGCIHILGSCSSSDTYTKYYKWDGSSWTEVIYDIPHDYQFCYGCAVVYKNGIHVLGGESDILGAYYNHFEFIYEKESTFTPTNEKWTEVSTVPYNDSSANAVIYNNEIHLLGGFQDHYQHWKWNGSSWSEVSTMPYFMWNGKAIEYNNELHVLGGGDYPGVTGVAQYHYKWDGTEWSEVSTLPYAFCYGCAVVYNNEIHIMGEYTGSSYSTAHYKWDGTSWTKVSTLPYKFENGCAVVWNNEIHIMGSNYNKGERKNHYKWDGIQWTFVSTLPYEFRYGSAVVWDNEIHIMGGSYDSEGNDVYDNHYKFDGSYWIEISDTFPCHVAGDAVLLYNHEINIIQIVDTNTVGYTGKHYKMEIQKPIPPVTLSVYRREFDGDFVEIAKGIKNGMNTYVIDPHPALDFARYRIVAIDNKTGAVSYNDPPGYPVGEKAIIIQWDEKWSNFDVDPDNEDALSTPPWTGSLLKLPYNIDVSDSNETDASLVEYIGRKHPVSYYGTQRGETASWSVDIPKSDKDTLYALRRLRVYMGDVYVREPSGSGYWARIKVSFSQTHCETVIPVSIELTRVEGGK